jgi:alkyl sulfatase BDS1-like metallo-beta-lactamase superfamily hydrolase
VFEVADRIWLSPGLSNSYLIGTDGGAVVVNAGMGFEGPVHRDNYLSLGAGPVSHLVLTQGHYDHVGGVDALREDGTRVVAHANWADWRDDNERLSAFRTRNAAFAWTDAISAALEHAAEHARRTGGGFPAQSSPTPELVVEDRLALDVGGRRIEVIATEGGETTDSLLVWLPEERICLCGNAFGALVGHIPNLVTMRGDRYRDALTVVETIDAVRGLGAEVLLTGHFGPVAGAAYIDAELGRLRDAVLFVHDETVRGMNEGRDVTELMRTVVLPPELEVGEGYGRVDWDVRAVWENYAGWFHHRSTTELYPVRPDAVHAELGALAGPDLLTAAAERRLAADDPVAAVQLLEVALAAEPDHRAARRAMVSAHDALLDRSTNFWETAWLRRERERWS